MEVNNGKDFYSGLMQRPGAEKDPDYAGLDQGPEGTILRHQAALDFVPLQGTSVLDLGCGTGLFLKYMAEHKIKPLFYHGVDLLERDMMGARLLACGIRGRFSTADLSKAWPKFQTGKFDTVLALGLMGPTPFHSYSSLQKLIWRMRKIGRHGIVTLPMMRPEFLGCEYQAHFDYDDVALFLRDSVGGATIKQVRNSPKELVIYW